MLAWMNREAYEETLRTRRAVVFQPQPQSPVAQGRGERPLSGSARGPRRLRRRYDPAQGASNRRRRLSRGLRQLLFPPRRGRGRPGRSPRKCSIPKECTENESSDPETRHSGGQFARGDGGLVSQSRVQDHLRQPQLLPRHRRSGDSVYANPRSGDAALRRGRLARLRPDRLRLDSGERRQGQGSGGTDFQQGEPPAGALGAGGAERFADPRREGPARQTHRHGGRQPDAALVGRARRDGPRRIQLGSHRGQAAPLGRRHRRSDGDRQLAASQQSPHRRGVAAKHDALHRQRARPTPIRGNARKWTTSC